jgi:hypothetical protein
MMRNLQPGRSENASNRPACGTPPGRGPESRLHAAAAICSPTWTAAPSAVAARYAADECDGSGVIERAVAAYQVRFEDLSRVEAVMVLCESKQ